MYLLRDDNSPSGYKEVKERLPDLNDPVFKRVELRPWALTKDGAVVYEKWDSLLVVELADVVVKEEVQKQGIQVQVQAQSKKVFKGSSAETKGLRLYDSAVSLARRREFETALARDAEANPMCVKPALDQVSKGVKEYYSKKFTTTTGPVIEDWINKFCYSNDNSSQLGTQEGFKKTNYDAHISAAFQSFVGTDIATIMTVQSAFAQMIKQLGTLDPAQKMRYDDCAARLQLSTGHLHTWFGTDELRGRELKTTKSSPTDVAGILKPDQSVSGNLAAAKNDPPHVRGIDLFERAEKSPFVRGLDMRNLVFGAGRSGSTKAHMLAYRLFAGIDDDEMFKQYLLATIVALVGKGHHTCHEVLSVASHVTGPSLSQAEGKSTTASIAELVKHAYVPGSYLKYLPQSYINTEHFEVIRERYYDIAVLGHLHGTFATKW